MTGWAAFVYVCGFIAFELVVALLIIAIDDVRESRRRRLWEKAMRLAVVVPDLVAQVAAEAAEAEDPDAVILPAAEHVASIDALPHDALVEKALTAEVREAELIEQVQNTQADAIAVVAEVLTIADANEAEAIRQTKAKRRHWSTVKRLKGTA